MLTVTSLTLRCTRGTCTTKRGRPSSQVIVLTIRTITVPIPAKGKGVQLALATAAFQLGDAPWTAAHATSAQFVTT